MRFFATLVVALMLVPLALALPAEAQQQKTRQQRAHRQPRAFTTQYKNQVVRNPRNHVQRPRPRKVNPRFYHSNAASQRAYYHRLRSRRNVVRARPRANLSPRRIQPRLYNPAAASSRLRTTRRAAQVRRAVPRRIQPTFWR